METKTRILHSLSLLSNLTIIAMVIYSISCFFGVSGGSGNMMVIGITCFRFFTNLSNILVGLMSLILVPYNIASLKSGEDKTPVWATTFKFIGTVSVTVTFVTVVLFLGPTMGYYLMFAGQCLYLHAIVPILAIISFIAFETKNRLSLRASFLGLLPTVLYSLLYLAMVVILKKWPDFYGFTFGGKIWAVPISMVVMYLATYVFCISLKGLHNTGSRLFTSN